MHTILTEALSLPSLWQGLSMAGIIGLFGAMWKINGTLSALTVEVKNQRSWTKRIDEDLDRMDSRLRRVEQFRGPNDEINR